MSTSGHDGLLRQNISGGRSVDPLLRLKEPTRLGDNWPPPPPAAGCTDSPGTNVESRVRRRDDRERAWGGVVVPGGGTTFF